VNDRFGHQMGNRALRAAGVALTANLRRSDAVGRYGGDEFVVVLPESDAEQAAALAKRLRAAVERATEGLTGRRISASVGVCQWDPAWSADELLRRADEALASAKAERAGVVVAA
jgi:diguanylate cyclase (GGDEF)-like protein